jgi:hypothetical protein
MPDTQRPWANEDATSTDAITARIAGFCAWTGATPPKLRIRKGKVILDTALEAWVAETGAPFNWVVCGDVQDMAVAFAEARLKQRRAYEATRALDDVEREALLAALTLVTTRAVPMEAALEAFGKAVGEKRAAA